MPHAAIIQDMIAVTIKTSALAKRCLEAQYGGSPITVNTNSVIFDLLLTQHITTDQRVSTFTEEVTLLVCAPYAALIRSAAVRAAKALDRYFKNMMCWYAISMVHAKGNGVAKPALLEWCNMNGVSEDDLSLETAYKIFQRFGWEFQKKGAKNSVRILDKTARNLYRKKDRTWQWYKTRQRHHMSDNDVEQVMAEFMAAYTRLFKRIPKRLPAHVRIYIYVQISGSSYRDAAARFGLHLSHIIYATRSLRKKMEQQVALCRIIEECCALPQAA